MKNGLLQLRMIVKLSNQGADLILQGDYDQAISKMVDALKLSTLVDSSWILSTKAPRASIYPPAYSIDACIKPFQHTHTRLPCRPKQQEEKFVYQDPIHIPSGGEYQGYDMISLVLFFNLALGNHLLALQTKCPSALQKALKLYELAYEYELSETDQTEDVDGESHDDSSGSRSSSCTHFVRAGSVRFTMIVLNNLGQVHSIVASATAKKNKNASTQHQSKSNVWFQRLLSIILFRVAANAARCHPAQQPAEEDLQHLFFASASHLLLRDECASAA
jgi:hypothetical protein